jgi:uncharacterized protein YjcR
MTKMTQWQQERLEDLAGKAKSRKELASEYGVCARTMRRWLKRKGFDHLPSELILPVDLRKIYKAFGLPVRKRSRW